ncbi:hypothetical protein L7F22_035150 [Adiantum nelumboides]|nr:hypothetical protein [Adiantum nelumboides]
MIIKHRRHFSSGIRPILRALAQIRDKEDANAINKLLKKTAQPSSCEQDTSNEPNNQAAETENLPLVVKAELERRTPNPPKKKDLHPPVPSWKTRRGWACMKGCGACCYLDKGPQYPPVEEVLKNSEEAALYKSMIGKDGWCKNFDKGSRTCKIYKDRPRFCRVEPDVLKDLFDIPEHKVDKEACSLCRDSISDVYGCKSRELKNFERLIGSLKIADKNQ